MASLTDSEKITRVLFNIPNLVCHLRILTGLLAFYYFRTWPMMTILSYSLSLNLDNVDGPCARYFRQSSKFGAVYDMIIDRMSTIVFMMHLVTLFPQQTWIFAFLSILDFSSHWFQMYAAQISGFDSHKALADHSAVLKMYYGCDPVKFAFSFGFEKRKHPGNGNPGVGSYTVDRPWSKEGLSIKRERRMVDSRVRTPGPGDYQVSSPTCSSFRFGGQKRGVKRPLDTPGPGTYSLRAPLMSGTSIGHRMRTEQQRGFQVGPGSYFPEERLKTEGGFIGKDKRMPIQKYFGPGPDHYAPSLRPQSAQFSIGQERRENKPPTTTPGPGHYLGPDPEKKSQAAFTPGTQHSTRHDTVE